MGSSRYMGTPPRALTMLSKPEKSMTIKFSMRIPVRFATVLMAQAAAYLVSAGLLLLLAPVEKAELNMA